MAINFGGQVAIVTGAGGGLGREYALALAARGAKVIVNDVATEPASKLVEEIAAHGGMAIANTESVASSEGASRLVDAAIQAWGRVDVLINNAGIVRDSSFAKAQLSDVEKVIQVHLLGSIYVTHACWPHMVAQNYGRIVMATSMVAYLGNFGQSAYAAAKMGMLGLMKTLAIEGARKGVTINAISPAAVTSMSQGLNPPSLEKYMTSDKVVPALLYLASNENIGSAQIIEAMAGGFGRVDMAENEFVTFDPSKDITAEMLAHRWADITDMSAARVVNHDPAKRPIDVIKSYGLWID